MAKRKTSKMNWSACKAVINDLPMDGIRELVHELYDLNAENRRFLHARLLSTGAAASVDEALSALKDILSASSIFEGNFAHADVRRIIDQFAKATNDPGAVCDLLCSDLEISLGSLRQVGDDEDLVEHIYASMTRLDLLTAELPREHLHALTSRIGNLAKKWDNKFGYGISDELKDFAHTLLDRCNASA